MSDPPVPHPTDADDADRLLAALAAEHARDVLRSIASVDDAIDHDRRLVRDLPGLPLPGPPVVAPSPTPREDTDPAAAARRRLADLLRRRDLLDRRRRRVTDPLVCEKHALAWLNGLRSAEQLLEELVPDPSLPRPFGRLEPRAALKIATAILRFRETRPRRRIERLADLAAVRGVDRDLLRHLLHTGCVLAEPRPDPTPDPTPHPTPVPPGPQPGAVGVLLPVRLETRFEGDTLRLRVIPDEPWFARHDPRVSEGEVAALRAYLDALAAAPGDDDARRIAWSGLVAQVGGARAVFLLRTFVERGPSGDPIVRRPSAAELRDEPALPSIEGFPSRLTVWLARGGGPPTEALVLEVDRGRLLADFADPDSDDRRWWDDWDEAVAIGMAGKIALDGGPPIDALYVTGIGDGDPATLFASHRDEGRLALLEPGTPTNTVDGAPAAPLADDPDTWWDVAQSAASPTDRDVSRALTGQADLLGNLPGPGEPHGDLNRAIVGGLWPALWGFAGTDVWGMPDGTGAAGDWAPEALHPEGPYPTLRVGAQPYGILPATSLATWQPRDADPSAERLLRPALAELASVWRDAAESRGTVVGTSTERLLDLIGQVPTSPLYRHRRAWPLELWWLILLLVGFGRTWEELDARWRERYPLAQALDVIPGRRYGAIAAARRLDIPLIWPDELPSDRTVGDVIEQLVSIAQEAPGIFSRTELVELEFLGFPPRSLLLRLVIRSLQVAIGDVGRDLVGDPPPGLEPIVRQTQSTGRLQGWIDAVPSGALQGATQPAVRFQRVVADLLALAQMAALRDERREDDRAERLLRATLDTATHRVDPWVSGPATRRLRELAAKPLAPPRLGAYGWVDDLRPGTPGPTPAGLIHAPSAAQATVATVLRDRNVADPQADRWDLDLTSRSVRDADRIAEHVRIGAHLAEAMGREVERVVGTPADVERLRRDFPVRTEHAGRRVCDGLAVLGADPGSLGLGPDRLAGLDRLRTALDAYGDLLVAEAVHHVTEGRAEVAGATMDAAAGFARPPHLGLLRTPREGRPVTTSALILLGDVAEPPLPADLVGRAEVSPASLADAAAAAFVRTQVGPGSDWRFEVAPVDATGAPVGASTTVTLDDLGILPADALALTWTDLARLATDVGAGALGVDPDVQAAAVVGGPAESTYERAARLVRLVGRNPAGPDVVTEQPETVVDRTGVDADLRSRLALVVGTARALVKALLLELDGVTADGRLGTADPVTLRRLVVAARSWGVAPDPPPDVVPDGAGAAEAAERRLVATAARAAELLAPRLAAVPADLTEVARDDLAATLATLVSPTGQIAVTSRLPRSALPVLDPAHAPFGDDWLPTVAAVRTPLARVEVHQLAAGTPAGSGPALTAWSNKPDDPWQQDAADARRMVVGYAAATLDLAALPGGARVAAATVDRLTEVVPEPEQTTGAVFGFDAPASRAPQAILLAVPPDLKQPLDDPTLVRIVAETRDLAHARVARPEDLGAGVVGLLPTSLLPASGPTDVPLEPKG